MVYDSITTIDKSSLVFISSPSNSELIHASSILGHSLHIYSGDNGPRENAETKRVIGLEFNLGGASMPYMLHKCRFLLWFTPPETNTCQVAPSQKRKGSSSSHSFSGAKLLLLWGSRVTSQFFNGSSCTTRETSLISLESSDLAQYQSKFLQDWAPKIQL